MEANVPSAAITYDVALPRDGYYALELHRYSSLNSVRRIRIKCQVDDGDVFVIESDATDEWRGDWKECVKDQVDRLHASLGWLAAGAHHVKFICVDQYFAFSGFLFCDDTAKAPAINCLRFLDGEQEIDTAALLEEAEQIDGISKRMARDLDKIWQESHDEAKSPCQEKDGMIGIHAALACADTPFAHADGGGWQCCVSETVSGYGLAMWVQKVCQPALTFTFDCEGGEYVIWILSWLSSSLDGEFGIGIGGNLLSPNQLYQEGNLWKYEAEQIWRHTPTARLSLERGRHELSIYVTASGIRIGDIWIAMEGINPFA